LLAIEYENHNQKNQFLTRQSNSSKRDKGSLEFMALVMLRDCTLVLFTLTRKNN